MDFWYLLISRSATVPGRKRWGRLSLGCFDGYVFLIVFLASCLSFVTNVSCFILPVDSTTLLTLIRDGVEQNRDRTYH